MFIDVAGRTYTLKKRAESQRETRTRIVEALMELHEEVGPRNATISAIAERAGVQRLTVYRHFPDEGELLEACSSHWLSLHPLPDPASWAGVTHANERCLTALTALYAHYRANERMWRQLHRDEDAVEPLRLRMGEFRGYLAGIGDELARALAEADTPRRAVRATLAHALDFSTWASLAAQDLSDEQAARLALVWARAAQSATEVE
jgi:AcrR family transcriptional regulator